MLQLVFQEEKKRANLKSNLLLSIGKSAFSFLQNLSSSDDKRTDNFFSGNNLSLS